METLPSAKYFPFSLYSLKYLFRQELFKKTLLYVVLGEWPYLVNGEGRNDNHILYIYI
jgi:hypothetical protein